MNRKQLTPQEKKLLSYLKDTRNTYGESGARSRFIIAKRKAIGHQAMRHEQKLILDRTLKSSEEETEIIESKMKSVKPKRWRKCTDTPLGRLVAGKLEKRYGEQETEKQKRILKKAKSRTPAKSRYDICDIE